MLCHHIPSWSEKYSICYIALYRATLSPSPSSLPSTRPSVRRLLFLQKKIHWNVINRFSLIVESSSIIWCCGEGNISDFLEFSSQKSPQNICGISSHPMEWNYTRGSNEGDYLVSKITVTEWLCQEGHPALCIVWGEPQVQSHHYHHCFSSSRRRSLVKMDLHCGVLVIVRSSKGWSLSAVSVMISLWAWLRQCWW